jgi:polyhydroxyalkanoate synthesis regulator phasin
MYEKLRKLGLYGIGVAVLTEEKIEEIVKNAVEEGKITREESKSAVQDLITESKKERLNLNRNVKKEVKKAIADLGVPTKKDISRLESRINSLEKEILKEIKQNR